MICQYVMTWRPGRVIQNTSIIQVSSVTVVVKLQFTDLLQMFAFNKTNSYLTMIYE